MASFDYVYDGSHWRPRASLLITSSDKVSLQAAALVDSGADLCLFPSALALLLGLRLSQMRTAPVAGLGGRPGVAYLETVTLDLGFDILVQTEVGFTTGLNFLGIGLLGQRGFFDRFRVCFDLPGRVFTIG